LFCVYRGAYRYDAYRDFFSSEIVEEYAKAWMAEGGSDDAYRHALLLKSDSPYAAEQLAYRAYVAGRLTDAQRNYLWTLELFQLMLKDARDWNTLPQTMANVERDSAAAIAQEGLIEERLGHSERAQAGYEAALRQDPACADAHYNLAVLYWKRGDWPTVVDHLQALSRSHPEDKRWQTYLPAALAHVRRSNS
jgi:tetratricopeptide (TPR) repeat protein